MPELDVKRDNYLGEHFPETKLSKDGFEVLSGLLTCNPEKRLTAAAALRRPWLAKIGALKLPKEELAPQIPKRRRLHAVCLTRFCANLQIRSYELYILIWVILCVLSLNH
jgi:hypothetical protein